MSKLVDRVNQLAPAATLLALLARGAAAQPAPIAWQFDLASARARAAQEHAPLLAVFRCEA